MKETLWKDARSIALDESVPWGQFDGKTVVITGATGLIGKTLAFRLSRSCGIPLSLLKSLVNEMT